jgi:hypothetical protein
MSSPTLTGPAGPGSDWIRERLRARRETGALALLAVWLAFTALAMGAILTALATRPTPGAYVEAR